MTDLTPTETKDRLKSLGLFGLLACWEQLADKPWLREVLAIEERERHKRSLERRLKNSRVAAFKPMTDFDSSWPKKIDREAVDDLYDSRYADLLFEVVTRRYDAQKPLLLSTNKAFADWGQVFPHAACVVTLVDRLVHRAEVIEIEAESYRLKEAKELNATRTKQRRTKKH
uniref:Putative transposase n=1 Tax=Sorangium cellulosum TaxID=56 RepID=Q9KJ01_SORCE|nr:putative transposase [Sorangium cellulosum]